MEQVPGHTQGRKASVLAFKIECLHATGTSAQKSLGLACVLTYFLPDCLQNMNFSFGHFSVFPLLRFLSTTVANWAVLISMDFCEGLWRKAVLQHWS